MRAMRAWALGRNVAVDRSSFIAGQSRAGCIDFSALVLPRTHGGEFYRRQAGDVDSVVTPMTLACPIAAVFVTNDEPSWASSNNPFFC